MLFIYVASLASNESFILSPSISLAVLISIFFGVVLMIIDPLIITLKFTIDPSFIYSRDIILSIPSKLSFIYNPSTTNITIFIILYLLLTLIVVVKITSNYFGPLRLSS